MDGVRNQRKRVRLVTEHEFGCHEQRVERGAERKCEAEMVGRMAVPGMGVVVRMAMSVAMVMRVIVVVMVVLLGHALQKYRSHLTPEL